MAKKKPYERLSKRYERIGRAALPKGWISLYSGGTTDPAVIGTSRPTTLLTLQLWLYACAIVHGVGKRKSPHAKYTLCTLWSFTKMEDAGLVVPEKIIRQAKKAVAELIKWDIQFGKKKVNSEALLFCVHELDPDVRRGLTGELMLAVSKSQHVGNPQGN
jgi:hypothetical protein